jgi:hypothetical protein
LIPRVRIRAWILAITWSLALALLLVLASPAAARADETSRATKKTDLAGFLHDIEELNDRIEHADAAGARAIADDLPAGWRVIHDRDDVRVDAGWIQGPLQQADLRPAGWAEARTSLVARLHVLRDEAAALDEADEDTDSVSRPKTEVARAALRTVLARSEFSQRDQAQLGNEIRRRLQRWLLYLLDHLPISRGATAAMSRVFAWIVGVGALIALAVYLYRMRLPQRMATSLAIDLPRPTSAEWAARAYAALRAGDTREAMHCGYHAVLFRLEEQGVWRVDDARTPREYVRLLPTQDARRAAFVDLTRRFEQTWYGSRVADGPGLLSHLEAFGCSAPSNPAI